MTMSKSKINLWHSFLISVDRFSFFKKKFWALFKTFRLQKDVMVINIFLEMFQKSEILKNAVSESWCMNSSLFSHVGRCHM